MPFWQFYQKSADWLDWPALLVQPSISAHRKWPEMVVSASINQVWTKITIRSYALVYCHWESDRSSVYCIGNVFTTKFTKTIFSWELKLDLQFSFLHPTLRFHRPCLKLQYEARMYLYMLCVVLRLKGPFYKVPRDALRMIDPKPK